ncbi:MAG: TetR/AcrR family transcriptional regulator [Aestuariibacter sp.]
MKTAERILLTTLELFNEQGESNVSCVEIAMELDISPGNLYYHYKGKEVMVIALFEMYKERMSKILDSAAQTELKIEDFFYFLLMVLQSSHLFRFLYHNPADLIAKYSTLTRGFKKLIKAQENTFNRLLSKYVEQGDMKLTAQQQHHLVQLITMVFTQATNYHLIKGEDIESEAYIYESLAHVLFALTPYMKIEESALQDLYKLIESEEL